MLFFFLTALKKIAMFFNEQLKILEESLVVDRGSACARADARKQRSNRGR